MIFLLIGILFLILFLILLRQEPRRFANVLLLTAAAVMLFIGFAELTQHVNYINSLFVFFLFGIVPLVMLLIAVLLILNGFTMMKREGRSLANLLSLLFGIAIIAGMISIVLLVVTRSLNLVLVSAFWLGGILTAYVVLTFTALLIYSALYLKLPKNVDCDYIIVHGCGLLNGDQASPLLKGRVDKAVEIWRRLGGRPKLILSGGQGPDEKIPEAEAMRNYLLELGISSDAMIMEDRSATTYENLQNVRDMLDRDGVKHRYLFVTNDYHVFRTGLFARKLGMNASGIGCRTAMYYWPSAFIREYIAVMAQYRWISIAVVLLWLMLMIVSMLPF